MSDSEKPIGPDTPLRLRDAAKIAFPFGGMTLAGLRSEKRRRNLTVETIAGKDFTTLRAIDEMRARCRAKAEDHISTSPKLAPDIHPSGVSATELTASERTLARDSALARANKSVPTRSPTISEADTIQRQGADVIQIKQ